MKKFFLNWIKTVGWQWIAFGAGAYLAMVLYGIYFLINPQIDITQKSKEKLQQLEDTYVNLATLNVASADAALDRQITEMERLKTVFRSRLVTPQQISSIVGKIDRYSTTANLKVESLEALNRTVPLPPNYAKLLIQTHISGHYSDFLKFLQKLEGSPEWLLIENFTLVPDGQDSSLTKFNLVLSLLSEIPGRKGAPS